jgi:DNA-binding IclR family transcriptional regulator
MTGEPKYQVRVIDRAVGILRCLAFERSGLSGTELAAAVGISKGTAHRLLSSLADQRLVQQDPLTKRYRLGLGLFELGNQVLAHLQPVEVAKPYLERLVEETGETANMAVMDGGMALYVAKVECSFSVRIGSMVGLRQPCHCTGLGKVLLAYHADGDGSQPGAGGLSRRTERTIVDVEHLRQELELVTGLGYALDDQEFEDGLRCIAAPVRDHTDSVIAAVSVSGPTSRITDDVVDGFAHKVVCVARDISSALGSPKPHRDGMHETDTTDQGRTV